MSVTYGTELIAVLNDREQRKEYLAKIQEIANGLIEDTAQIHSKDDAPQSPQPLPNCPSA